MIIDRPKKIVLNDESYFPSARRDALAGLAFMAFVAGICLFLTDAVLSDLILPLSAMGAFWLLWILFHGCIALIYRLMDKRAINNLFKGEIWSTWQFSYAEWQQIVDNESKLISPQDKGLGAYTGALYSSLFGAVFAGILIAVGQYAMTEPLGKTVFRICGLAVFFLFLGVGLFQPLAARHRARCYRRKALRVREPRVWFSKDGIYHEALGYTSLSRLEKVTDQTRSRNTITFTIAVTTVFGSSGSSSSSTDLLPVPFHVPQDCKEQAAELVKRYRRERLNK